MDLKQDYPRGGLATPTSSGFPGFIETWPKWVFPLILAAVTFIAYAPVWRAGFIWDDDTFLLNNPLIQKSDGLYQFWFTTAAPDYFPVTSSTLWLEWHLWGAHPLGYHLVNVFLHAASAALLWRALAALKIPGAPLAAVLFAIHPVNVESVAWVTERKNTLCMFFYLLGVLWCLRGEEERVVKPGMSGQNSFGDFFSSTYYWFSLCAFALALLSKSAVAPLPVVLLGIAWWQRGRIGLRDFLRTVPFFAVAGAAALVSIWFQFHRAIGASMVTVRHDTFLERLAVAGWAVWFYLYKALLPLRLSFVYPKWHVDGGSLLSYLPGLLLLAAFAVCWRFRRGWGKPALFALGYFVVMLLPVLGFLNIYFMRYSLVADHWQYFAIIGPISLVAAGVASLATVKNLAWLSRGIGLILVIALGFLTWRENGLYQNVETLWLGTLQRNPNATLALNNLGYMRLQNGRFDEAESYFRKALKLQPDAPDVLSNLGVVLLRQGNVEEAIKTFRDALVLEPGSAQAHNNLGSALLQEGKAGEAVTEFQKVLTIQSNAAGIEQNLGDALLRAGRADEALAHLQRAVTLEPGLADAQMDLGDALVRSGQIETALVHLRKAVELKPQHATTHYGLGNALFQSGDLAGATAEFQRAIELDPSFAGARNGLGNVFLRQGDPDRAIAEFKEALRAAPNLAETHFNLANALLAKGDTEEAILHLERGLALQPRNASAHNNLASALLRKGRTDDAIAQLKVALGIQPNLPEAQNNLANALLGKGRIAEAVQHYEAALAALPQNPYLLNNLAWVLATCPDAGVRNGSLALELAQRANDLADGKVPAFLGTLAAAYAEVGRYPEAAATAQRALDLATAQNKASQIGALRDRLGLYKSGLPFRDSELTPKNN